MSGLDIPGLAPLAAVNRNLAPAALIEAASRVASSSTRYLSFGERPVCSPCFVRPFLPRPPALYGRMLKERIARHELRCWLVNTGWTGGGYGVGRRMSIATTRALLCAALSGRLDAMPFRTEPHFGLAAPTACPGVDPPLLDPRATWADPAAYDVAAAVAARFSAVVTPLQAAMAEDARRAA